MLGCSDSRVPPELVFDQGLGDLFVVRVAGNVISPLGLDSIRFAVKHLKSSAIVVLGHENCGAVAAVANGTTEGVEDLALSIEPAIRNAKNKKSKDGLSQVNMCVQENVRNVVTLLKKAPALAKLLEEGKLEVVGGYYDLEIGRAHV